MRRGGVYRGGGWRGQARDQGVMQYRDETVAEFDQGVLTCFDLSI